MDFTEVTIYTTTLGIDLVANALDENGIEGYVLEDSADFAEFLQETEIYWDYIDEELMNQKTNDETKIKIYLTQDDMGASQLKGLAKNLATLKQNDTDNLYGRLEFQIGIVCQEDWEWGWKQYFKPFPVGERFVVKPSWEEWDEKEGRMILEIDPASSFGTGSHETTQLCMTALEKCVKQGDNVLDMGTGSGILAIAAAMLGANVLGIADIDENCLKTAQENAEKNNVKIGDSFCGDAMHDDNLKQALGGNYDIIVANIVADVIIGMSNMFFDKLVSKGTLICSGILSERADEVALALENAGFAIDEKMQRGDWAAFTAHKK